MSAAGYEQRRTGWDIIFGALLLIAGFIVLGNAVIATAVSVYFVGWMAVISGAVLLIGSFFRIKSGGFWSAALGGALLLVLGVFVLRNPLIGAVSLTLLAGSLFLTGGLMRIVVAFQVEDGRWLLIISGAISVVLGLFVLFNIAAATLTLLGVLLGVQTLVEGITLMIVGRSRRVV